MENYVVIKQVGKGSFGTAEVVEDKREKNRYILKKTRLARQPELQREASIQEMFLQSAVHHRNIVRCREKWMDKAFVANLVLEYCPQGELASTFQTRFRHQYFEEDAILDMFVQASRKPELIGLTLSPAASSSMNHVPTCCYAVLLSTGSFCSAILA